MEPIQAIDVHGHFGNYAGDNPFRERFMSADAGVVANRAAQNHIALTFVSSLLGLLPRGQADAAKANIEAQAILRQYPTLRPWVIVDPRCPQTFDQARELLTAKKCVGIKIHPEEHIYPIREYGEALFKLAAEFRTIVLTHSGERNSLPADFVPFADAYPEMTLILAHLGCGHDDNPTHQIRAIQAHRHGNLYVDTSSASNLLPGLIEYAVGEIGADRMLFGTDTPLYFLPMQRARIDRAEISEADRHKILHQNAESLFKDVL